MEILQRYSAFNLNFDNTIYSILFSILSFLSFKIPNFVNIFLQPIVNIKLFKDLYAHYKIYNC